MEWHVRPDSAAAAERDVKAYLRRHGDSGSDFAAADNTVEAVLAGPSRRPVSVGVEWDRGEAVLRLAGRERADASPEDVAAGVAPERNGDDAEAVSMRLPVTRRGTRARFQPRPPLDPLPFPEEADPEGAYGRESFLRALVVQLAQEVEREHGPDAAEAAIAQVGSDVGGRMEDEYRRARGLVERLSPEEMGDLYVRLKAAIAGDFYVIEASDEKIVLGNRRCPFGDAVRRAPGLCRMTSSVFGGIAARNAGASTVQLDQRIAVGDPECRVTVWLGPNGRGLSYGHVYEEPPAAVDPIRVVLAESYAFLRDPLVAALTDAGVEVVSYANSAENLLFKVEKYEPDVAIIDFSEAETTAGLETAATIRRRWPHVGVLILAEALDAAPARELLASGSSGVGYLLKDKLSQSELGDALRRLAGGAAALAPEIVPELVGGRDPLDDLSPRELEVLELLSEGLSNGAIAERIVVSKRAVEKHVKSIFRKLGLDSSSEHERRVLAALAFVEVRGRRRAT